MGIDEDLAKGQEVLRNGFFQRKKPQNQNTIAETIFFKSHEIKASHPLLDHNQPNIRFNLTQPLALALKLQDRQ